MFKVLSAAFVTRNQVVDANVRERINNKQQQHFRPDQYHVHDTFKTPIPEEIPE